MGDTKRLKFDFNTAITGVGEEKGAFNDAAHNQTVLPLRGRVMQIDGVTGCYIARYGMEIDYIPGITSKKSIIAAVKAAVRDVATKDNFFPLKGSKAPAAYIPRKKSAHRTWWVAQVTFDSDLFIDSDPDFTKELIEGLITKLAAADGARKPNAGQRVMYVCFDRRVTSPNDMKSHLETVVRTVMTDREEKNYFPFADPNFTYRTYASNSII